MAEGGFRKKLARFLKGPPKVRKEVEKQKEPTKEQVEEWTTSFTRLLLDEEGVRVFRQFMTKGETEEGELTKDLDCLCSCLEFRESAKALEIQAKEIFDTYFEENGMLMNRVYQVKKLTRRLRRERRLLIKELDKHGDNFRNVPLTFAIEEEVSSVSPQSPVSQSSSSLLPSLGRPKVASPSSVPKAKTPKAKTERDKNAPKRPTNAFLQFCQEQRAATQLQLERTQGQTQVSRQQLTKLLAHKWNKLTEDAKKVYIERFERDKERYSDQMRVYETSKMEAA